MLIVYMLDSIVIVIFFYRHGKKVVREDWLEAIQFTWTSMVMDSQEHFQACVLQRSVNAHRTGSVSGIPHQLSFTQSNANKGWTADQEKKTHTASIQPRHPCLHLHMRILKWSITRTCTLATALIQVPSFALYRVNVTAVICRYRHNVPMSYSYGIAGW
jgi:hypothetical protein